MFFKFLEKSWFAEMGACRECQRICALIHGQRNPNPVVVSFFKVIISSEFLETLFLPPGFVQNVSHLVDQEIYLEDSIGVKSKATVSNCNGSLAIQQGWRQFSLDHHVQTGDFLVLYLINGPIQHFVVHIYGRTGCLKTNFDAPTDRSHKRARTIKSLPERDETAGINSMNKESSPTSFAAMPGLGNNHHQPLSIAYTPIIHVDNGRQQSSPPAMHLEEPFYMIGQDTGYNQEENRVHLFDLSSFEMPAIRHAEGNNNFSKGKNEPLDLVQRDVQSEKDTMSLNDLVFLTKREAYHSAGRIDMTREESNGTSHFDEKMKSKEKEPMQMRAQGVIIPRSEMPASRPAERKSILIGDRKTIEHVESEVIFLREKSSKESITPHKNRKSPCTGSVQMARAECGAKESITPCKNKKSPCTGNVQMARAECGGASDVAEEMRVVKKEPMEMGKEDTGNELNMRNKSYKSVKSEPVDSEDTSILAAASKDSFLVLVDRHDFLELPDCWPKKRSQEKKIIFLKDPINRVWPALYHKKKQLRVLAGGWKEFSVANELEPGHECVFQAEEFPDYSVDIRRK